MFKYLLGSDIFLKTKTLCFNEIKKKCFLSSNAGTTTLGSWENHSWIFSKETVHSRPQLWPKVKSTKKLINAGKFFCRFSKVRHHSFEHNKEHNIIFSCGL